MAQHGKVVGAVAEHIAIVQGSAQIIHDEINARRLGTVLWNQLIKMIVAHRFPLYADEIIPDRFQKAVKITVGVTESHKLVKIHVRVVKIPHSARGPGAGISIPDPLKRRDQRRAVIKKAGGMSLKGSVHPELSEYIFQSVPHRIRQFVMKKRFTAKDHFRAAAAYVSVKWKRLNGLRHKRAGAAAVDKKKMSVLLRLFKPADGALRNITGNPARKQRPVNVKKQ